MRTNLYYTLLLIIISCKFSFASLTINCITEACGSVTPFKSYTYTATDPDFKSCSNLSDCRFKWEVTNGKFFDGTTVYEGNYFYSPVVVWDNFNGSGTLKVTTSTSPSCSTCPNNSLTSTFPIKYLGTPGNIKVNGSPHASSISLPCGVTSVTLSVDPVTNATNYQWSLPPGWTPTNPSNSNSITVNRSINTPGLISVTTSRSDAPGLSTSNGLNTTRQLPILNTVTPSSSSTIFCNTLDSRSVSATGTYADKFTWEPTGGIKINGFNSVQTASGPVTISATSAGTYRVRAYSTACQLESTNNHLTTASFGTTLPTGQTLTLMDAGSNMYQFYYFHTLNNAISTTYSVYSGTANLIPFAIHDVFVSTMTGATIQGISTNACGPSTFHFVVPPPSGMLTVYPNPVENQISIQLKNTEINELIPETIVILNELGITSGKSINVKKLVDSKQLIDGNKIIVNVTDLPRGTYYLKSYNNKGAEIEQIRLKLQ